MGQGGIDAGTLNEVTPEERLDVDEGPDSNASEGGREVDVDDLYDDPGEVVSLDGRRLRGGPGLAWATPYERATECTGGPADGARALLAWALEVYGDRGARSLGIYNCRTVRGGSTKSLHGEGRAVDLGLPLGSDGKGIPVGHKIVRRLGVVGVDLGVQSVIYDRRIWSAVSPDGRAYKGVHPHYDHLHIELTRKAGRVITLATCRHHLGGGSPGAAGSATAQQLEEDMFCREGDVNPTVEYWQRLLKLQGHYSGKLDADYGPKTRAAVAAAGFEGTDGKKIGPAEAAAIHLRMATSKD